MCIKVGLVIFIDTHHLGGVCIVAVVICLAVVVIMHWCVVPVGVGLTAVSVRWCVVVFVISHCCYCLVAATLATILVGWGVWPFDVVHAGGATWAGVLGVVVRAVIVVFPVLGRWRGRVAGCVIIIGI